MRANGAMTMWILHSFSQYFFCFNISTMQCHQPLFGIGYPSPGQYFQSNSVNPCNGLAPDVIGEGEVTSVTFPDGTIQYYFLPVRCQSDVYTKRWPSYPFIDGYNCNGPHKGVWIIRNFSTRVSPIFNQYWQKNVGPFSKPCFNHDCNGGITPGYQLKFHNDCWTSTTDLHCFCTSLRRPPLPTTCSASVQVDVDTSKEPKCACHTVDYNIPCTSAKCTCNDKKEHNNNSDQCKCKKGETTCSSRMSIDKSRTSSDSCSLNKSKSKKKKRKKSYTSTSCSSSYDSRRATRKRKKVICECHLQSCISAKIKNNGQKQAISRSTSALCEDVGLNTDGEPIVSSQKVFKKKSSKVHCECNVQSIADKVVATYNDQASSVKEVEGQTQTKRNLNRSCSKLNLKRQVSDSTLWVPKRLLRRNWRSAQYPEKIIGVCEISSSGSSSSSCYCRCSTSHESVQ